MVIMNLTKKRTMVTNKMLKKKLWLRLRRLPRSSLPSTLGLVPTVTSLMLKIRCLCINASVNRLKNQFTVLWHCPIHVVNTATGRRTPIVFMIHVRSCVTLVVALLVPWVSRSNAIVAKRLREFHASMLREQNSVVILLVAVCLTAWSIDVKKIVTKDLASLALLMLKFPVIVRRRLRLSSAEPNLIHAKTSVVSSYHAVNTCVKRFATKVTANHARKTLKGCSSAHVVTQE